MALYEQNLAFSNLIQILFLILTRTGAEKLDDVRVLC
jgi:hypothetical protein